MIIITHDHEHIKVDCDSYVLLKDAEATYNQICNAFKDNNFIIGKWIIHEQVLDVVVDFLSKSTTIDLTGNTDKITLFGIPIEILKK